MSSLWQKRWVRISVYSSFFSSMFLISLVLTYPSTALVAEIESGVAKGAPDIKNLVIEHAAISGLGLRLQNVEFTYGKGEIPWRFDDLRIGLAGFGFDPENPAFSIQAVAYGGEVDIHACHECGVDLSRHWSYCGRLLCWWSSCQSRRHCRHVRARQSDVHRCLCPDCRSGRWWIGGLSRLSCHCGSHELGAFWWTRI